MQRLLPCSPYLGYLPLFTASGLGGGVLASLALISPALALDQIATWQFDPVRQQLSITLPPQVTPTYKIRADGRAILLHLPATRLGASPTTGQYDGSVRQVHLSQIDPDQVEVTLELAMGLEVTPEQVSLVALPGESETRWLLTALVAEAPASASPSPSSSPPMTGELPPVPTDPNLRWPYQGVGRLSIAAANLMLPANLDTFNTLPETLAIDPFNLGLPSGEPVSVPTLAELDVAVGQAQVELAPATVSSLPVPDLPQGTSTASLTLPPPTQPSLPVEDVQNQQEPLSTPSPSSISDRPPAPETVAAIPVPVDSAANETVVTQVPTTVSPESNPSEGQAAPSQPQSQTQPQLDPLTIEPPSAAITAYLPAPSTPEPDANSVLMAAEQPISFGQPLPGQTLSPPATEPSDRPLPPDILIASGTILELRYPGSEDLVLTPNLPLNEVLTLAQDLRDPITQGIIAPAGSQLIGQFETVGHHQQWVSHMIILPTGQRVPFPSTSDYLVGTPQVSGGSLALGSGVGALALTLLGGFSGVGLLGGALMGATATLGLAPQTIVIEPNQTIYAQVMDDIPRAIPIALSPGSVQPWGTEPNW